MKRRDFLNVGLLTAASVAMTGCGRAPDQALVSQAFMPEFYLPGIAQWYATTCGECSGSCALGIRIIGGRAKKVEGIPQHPRTHGAHCLRAESALQALYNPDRVVAPQKREGGRQVPVGWAEALRAFADSVKAAVAASGSALWITGPLRGTQGALLSEVARRAGARIWVHDYPGSRVERLALVAAGDKPRLPSSRIADADYIVNFGSDFLGTGPDSVDAGWQYGLFRSGGGRQRRGIMVSFCSRMNMTASNSDRWVPTRPGTEGWIAAAVGGLLQAAGKGSMPSWARVTPKQAADVSGVPEALIKRLAERLARATRPVVLGGYDNAAHANGFWSTAVIQALSRALGGGKGDTWEPDLLVAPQGLPARPPSDLLVTTRQAVEGLQKGTFQQVWINDANPAFLLPSKLDIAGLLAKVHTVFFGCFTNETSVAAEWHLPITTWLEEWGDVLVDGPAAARGATALTYGIRQPAAAPWPGCLPFSDILLATMRTVGGPMAAGLKDGQLTKDLVQGRFAPGAWLSTLARGGVWTDDPGSQAPYPHPPMFPPPPKAAPAGRTPTGTSAWTGLKASPPPTPAEPPRLSAGQFTLIPYPSPIWQDGSLANRPWVPEIPDPMSQAVWDTWVEINPEVARALGIERGDLVQVTSSAGSMTVPALVLPTVHPEAVAVPVGMGHTSYGRYAFGKGANPLSILEPTWQEGTDEIAWASTPVTLRKVGRRGRITTYDWRAGNMQRGLGTGSGIGGE